MNKYIRVKNINREFQISADQNLCEKQSLVLRDWQGPDNRLLNGLMLSLFALQSPQLQRLHSLQTYERIYILWVKTRCFPWCCTVCWGWMTSTPTNSALPPTFKPALPTSHRDTHFRALQPPPPKLPRTGGRQAQCCPSLWLLCAGCWQCPTAQQLSVQVNCLSWATTATISKWSYGDLANSLKQRELPLGEATLWNAAFTGTIWPFFFPHRNMLSQQAKSPETMENIPTTAIKLQQISQAILSKSTVCSLLTFPHCRAPSLSLAVMRN